MKHKRTTPSAPQAALVHALTQCLNSAFASNEITAFDIRDALDLAWQRAWNAARSEPEAEPESPPLPIIEANIRFVRKPCDLDEAFASLNAGDRVTRIQIQARKSLTEAEYDAFADRLLADQEWLAGFGGSLDAKTRRVVEVTAPNRPTLYIDPQGGNYARYVGIADYIDAEVEA